MLESINNENILFLDIETVPQYHSYLKIPENIKHLWDKKSNNISKNESETPEITYERAGIYAEFGKIVCISVGYLKKSDDVITNNSEIKENDYYNDIPTEEIIKNKKNIEEKYILRIKSFANHDEKQLLTDFISMLNTYYNKKDSLLCAHNGKEFDYPYLCRRILINGLQIPSILDISGKKPWEIQHLDTMELWKFGDYKSYTSLELLATIFNIKTPKDDIKGSDVGYVYWIDNDLERIVKYCQKDVVTIVQLLLRYKGMKLIDEYDIKFV